MSRRAYFSLAIGLFAIFAELGAVAVWTWTFAGHASSARDAVLALIATFTPFVAVLLVLAPVLAADYKRPSKLPRIENLRIAGKYSGKAAAMGISPLDLRF